ncbi:MAG TPA: protein kinase [Thermoanaerobaculia bacterium]|nr:protein kinase [Thermoanaerobaculia bacterium]
MTDLPQSLDRFEIVRILGRGGMGTVYLAKDQRLGRQVALKVLHLEQLAGEDRRTRFLREARAVAAVRHQNVATIYEVDETDEGVPFLVMEYCEGETLSQRMRRRPLDSAEFLTIAKQISAGVAAAHDNGIVHRDIKSANIIIEPTGLVKILDFGLAKLVNRDVTASRDSSTGQLFGTLHYISPEQARGATADERSDLFSVGIVLYQMASGQLPFTGDAPLAILAKIRDSEPEPFIPLDPALPSPIFKIIGRLLQKDPKDRYQSARELQQDLQEIDTPTVQITTGTTRTMLRRTVRKPRTIQIAVVAVALLVFISAIVISRRHTSDDKPNTTTATAAGGATPLRSMAVLPLDNLANNTHDEFLSVSLADALVTKLQEVPTLQVRPTSAVLDYRGKKIDAKAAAKALQVDGILAGSFIAAGDIVRVNLQLTDARTGYNVWTDSAQGKRQNLLQLIDDVSDRTARGLGQKLSVKASAPTSQSQQPRSSNPQAYEEYLKSRALVGSFFPEDHKNQIEYLKKAIDLDPNFAAAYADLASALSLGQARGLASDDQTLQRAQWYARQAVRLDPNLASGHLALSRVFVRDPDRYRESVRENLAALRVNANDPQSLQQLANYFVATGETTQAKCMFDKLVAIDPSSNEAKTRAYWNVNVLDPEGAIQNAQYALANKSTEPAGHDVRALAFIMRGSDGEAEKEADRVLQLVPQSYLGKGLKAMIAADRGDRDTAVAYLKMFESDGERYHWAALRQCMVYARLGDRDNAIKWLQKSYDLGNHSWYQLVKHPWFASLQSDPEFQKLVVKMKQDLDDVYDDVTGVYQLICR